LRGFGGERCICFPHPSPASVKQPDAGLKYPQKQPTQHLSHDVVICFKNKLTLNIQQ
jgi:hypothetical protein